MTKPYQTTTPQDTSRAPHHRTPVEMTALWARAIGLLTLAALFVVAGLVSAVMTGALEFLGVGILFAVIAGVPGAILALYTKLEHGTAYGRERQGVRTIEREHVIYTHNEVKPKTGGGYTVEQSKHEARFTDGVREVALGVAWMLKTGKSDRRSVQAGLGWSPDKFSRIMSELATFGMATNQGRGTGNGWKIDPKAYDWTKSLDAEIDDLFDDLDRM